MLGGAHGWKGHQVEKLGMSRFESGIVWREERENWIKVNNDVIS